MSFDFDQNATQCYIRSMSEYPARDLRNDTAGLIRRAQAGEDVVITVSGKPTARLVAISDRERPGITGAQLAAALTDVEADPTWRNELRELRGEVGTVGSWDDVDN
jgi:hypothetical protein